MFRILGKQVTYGNEKTGDLVFYSRSGIGVAHVGVIVVKEDVVEVVHAPGKDGTFVSKEPLCPEFIIPFPQDRDKQVFFYNPIGFKRLG